MGDRDLSSRLRATFVQELHEQVKQMNEALLALEQRPHDAELIRTLFRSAHTVKGAARVAGVSLVERVCHALESLFVQLRDEDRAVAGPMFSILFAAVDGLGEAGTRLRASGDADTPSLRAVLPRLQRLTGTLDEDHSGARVDSPSAGPPAAEPTGLFAGEPPFDSSASVPRDPAKDRVRVRADRLDELLAAVGELRVATSRVIASLPSEDQEARRLSRATEGMVDLVRRLRLRPLADAFEALPRVVRDAAASEGKQAALVLRGEQVEADRLVVDTMREPLLHLVRNAVTHGIEAPARRESAGKPRQGTVEVAAEVIGGRLLVTVSDDGGGIDEAGIRAAARARGRPEPRTRDDIAEAILAGGLSTTRRATALSGRGVGVDIVRVAMHRIGGSVEVRWQAGAGTTFVLESPPSAATIRAVLVRLGQHVFAIPTPQIDWVQRVREQDLRTVEGRPMLDTSEGPVPAYLLAALLGPPFEARQAEGAVPALIVHAGARRAALLVDDVLNEEEIVVRALPDPERSLAFALGATILPTGSVGLVLGVGVLLAAAAHGHGTQGPVFSAPSAVRSRRVLVADDSITTRTLEQSVLEAAGYEVVAAVDGLEAWQRLEAEGADAVVADVEMPRMDGFALCRRIRSSTRFADLPIVLVTALASPEDRARGLEAGADAYIVKSGFDEANLVEAVHQLIGGE